MDAFDDTPLREPKRVRDGNGRREVRYSRDLERILALPVKGGDVSDLTERYRKPGGTMELFPVQSAALHDAQTVGGLLGFVRPGDGKSGIALLLPTVLNSRCAVIITRSQLLHQMTTHDLPMWVANFDVRVGVIRFVTYEQLSDASTADVLDRLYEQGLDLAVVDEAHLLRYRDAARTKRVLRFFHDHPDVRCCLMSGTLTTKSLMDFGHLADIALRDQSPLPRSYPDLAEWARALDADADGAYGPGALYRLCKAPQEPVRVAFRRRLMSTPGVVHSMSGLLPLPLYLHERTPPPFPAEVQEQIEKVRKDWVRPDGEELDWALTFYECLLELAAGYYSRWVKEAHPAELWNKWNDARQAWHCAARAKLKQSNRHGWDSPKLLALNASTRICRRQDCQRYDKPEAGEQCHVCGSPVDWRWTCPEYHDWVSVRDLIKPETQMVWLSDVVVKDAVQWGLEYPGGVIWTRHPAVGQAIAALGEYPYYGAGSSTVKELAKENGTRTIVCSIRCHGEGKNLQIFPRNLVVEPPGNASAWEQLFARSHRVRSTAERVDYWSYRHTPELRKSFDTSLAQASYQEELTGIEQRILQAGKSFSFGESIDSVLLHALNK